MSKNQSATEGAGGQQDQQFFRWPPVGSSITTLADVNRSKLLEEAGWRPGAIVVLMPPTSYSCLSLVYCKQLSHARALSATAENLPVAFVSREVRVDHAGWTRYLRCAASLSLSQGALSYIPCTLLQLNGFGKGDMVTLQAAARGQVAGGNASPVEETRARNKTQKPQRYRGSPSFPPPPKVGPSHKFDSHQPRQPIHQRDIVVGV